MSIRSILLNSNPTRYPLPTIPFFTSYTFPVATLAVQQNVQEVLVTGLPTDVDLADLGITNPVLIASLTNSSVGEQMLNAVSNIDYTAGTCSVWVSYSNSSNLDISFWICQNND